MSNIRFTYNYNNLCSQLLLALHLHIKKLKIITYDKQPYDIIA